jgi:hypothetical protein
MITYDLTCIDGHRFEAWFKDYQSFTRQRQSGQVECPACGSTEVEIAFTGCAVHTGRRSAEPLPPRDSIIQRLASYLERNFEDVGERFADEARQIHHGESKQRNIRGTATPGEEEALRDEGIGFVKIPLPKLNG